MQVTNTTVQNESCVSPHSSTVHSLYKLEHSRKSSLPRPSGIDRFICQRSCNRFFTRSRRREAVANFITAVALVNVVNASYSFVNIKLFIIHTSYDESSSTSSSWCYALPLLNLAIVVGRTDLVSEAGPDSVRKKM
ncbi:hypothetical protein CEXT_726351 [Caerostris extrusa]|uniref:Uncharacterized protein n=1 Tax=Caerostris extrusa TaxID=172846 RepID=A0AAV4XPL9_CAEEX|nr:hypothetical protein CEXT_726351 [Caerostris extrusa]